MKSIYSYTTRSSVHEYGGVAFVIYNNTLYFTSSPASFVFKQVGHDGTPQVLSNKTNRRYADGSYSPQVI